MNGTHMYRMFWPGSLVTLLVCIAMGAGSFSATHAQGTEAYAYTQTTTPPLQQGILSSNDDGLLEVGVEWVNDYGNKASYLPKTDDDALGLYHVLVEDGWSGTFSYGNGNAWEKDWKLGSNGGTENRYTDAVDLAYFSGHGDPKGIYFGVGGEDFDDWQASPNDCQAAWGDGDAEWVALAACLTLDNAVGWSQCMNGLHLILGFQTPMADVEHGYWFARYLSYGYTMSQAWFKATDRLQPQGIVARILAEDREHFNDISTDHIGGDTVDHQKYIWDHQAGSEPARMVDLKQIGHTMPAYHVLKVFDNDDTYTSLGQAFGVDLEPTDADAATFSQDDTIRVSSDGQLEMDTETGMYTYTDRDALWVAPEETALQAPNTPTVKVTADDAQTIADQFLTDNELMPHDAQFYEVVNDTITAFDVNAEGTLQQDTAPETTAYQVTYSRILQYTPSNTNVSQTPVAFSVVGPGAKLKVYVPTEVPAITGVAQTDQAIIGGLGGWRHVLPPSGTTLQQTTMVEMLDREKAVKLLEQLEPTVALGYTPVVAESREIVSETVAYYEHAAGIDQDELIPIYVFNVRATLEDGATVDYPVYIPVNPTYMAPLAQITPPTSLANVVEIGQQITLEATDAAQALSHVGYDSSLDFALGTNDSSSYRYTWYHDEVSDENQIGTGRTLTYQVELGQSRIVGGIASQTIILEVTDSASQREPNTSWDSHQININVPLEIVYLPLVQR